MNLHRILGFVLAGVLATAAAAQAPAPAPLRVITFDGGWNLPLWAAQRQGYFEANGIAVQLTYTPSSAVLVASLLDGRADIALALIDNLVAYQEGQGEAKLAAPTCSRSWAATAAFCRWSRRRASGR